METYKILGSLWFGGVIGIVRVQTEYDGIKYFIGQGNGINQEDDEQHIASYGSTASPEVIKSFMEGAG